MACVPVEDPILDTAVAVVGGGASGGQWVNDLLLPVRPDEVLQIFAIGWGWVGNIVV